MRLISSCQPPEANEVESYDVVVLGEGTGAVAAAVQSARSGAKTLLVNPLPWLGGMLTSAGVSATDGNHQLPAGLWGEFRGLLRQHYGGADSLFTGWVSNTMFEPKIGAKYWEELAQYFPCLKNARSRFHLSKRRNHHRSSLQRSFDRNHRCLLE